MSSHTYKDLNCLFGFSSLMQVNQTSALYQEEISERDNWPYISTCWFLMGHCHIWNKNRDIMTTSTTLKKKKLNLACAILGLPKPINKRFQSHDLFLLDAGQNIVDVKLCRCIFWDVLHSTSERKQSCFVSQVNVSILNNYWKMSITVVIIWQS